ncbi:MAG: helix-turn-helix domain-containing protein [Planctomycetia bacterium]|nr:helix-turn-helix domain-containing protein [Planctomycetia bacterium]
MVNHAARSSTNLAVNECDETQGLFHSTEVHILVIDDDSSVCRMIQAALTPQDLKVTVQSDPNEMRPSLEAQPYHLIILDYVIPGWEPEQTLEWLRQHQPQASIIVITAYPLMSRTPVETFDCLTKPFAVSSLQQTVLRCLEGRGLLRMSESALREVLGSVIRERRKGLGLTLAQMAQRTGVSLGYLSQIELGKNSASIETLYRISLGLGIKMAELFQTLQPGH